MEKTKVCKDCQSEISKKAKICPICRSRQRKSFGSLFLTAVLYLVIIVCFFSCISGNSSNPSDDNPQKVGDVGENSENNNEQVDNTKNEFSVGEIIETSNLKISFLSASEYNPNNEFLQPQEGYVFWRFEFEFENISNSDQTVSSMIDWSCYADDYDMKQSWTGEDSLDAQLSAGKKAKGAIYFELPKEFANATLEYKTNYWNDNKVVFRIR